MCFAVESAVKCLLAERKLLSTVDRSSVYKCIWLSLLVPVPAAARRSCNGKYSMHLDLLLDRQSCCLLSFEAHDKKKEFHHSQFEAD